MTTCPSWGSGSSPDPGAEIERWVVTLAGPDGEVVAAVESRPSEQAAHLTCHATHPAHSRTWHVTLEV